MGRIRVALGDVQSAMLRDILTQITDQQADMVFVGQIPHPVKAAITEQKPDVLICEIRPGELPEVCRELFADPNPPVVVGLAREGRDAAVCIASAGAAQLMSMIRSAILNVGEAVKVPELARAAPTQVTIEPYRSNSDCLNDQLRILDLALLAEVDDFESTIWDESAQRLQGLAITPGEVRAMLQGGGSPESQRHSGDLSRRRLRLQEHAALRIEATPTEPTAPPLVRLMRYFSLDAFEQFCIVAALALEIDRNKYGKAFAFLQDDLTRKQPSFDLFLRLHQGLDDASRWDAARAFDASRPLLRWRLLRLAPREAGEPATPFGRRVELDDRIARYLLGLEDLGSQLEEFASAGPWGSMTLREAHSDEMEEHLIQLIGEVQQGAPDAPPVLVAHVHGREGSGRRSLVTATCNRLGLRILRVDAARLAALPAAALEESLVALSRESILQPTSICIENVDALLDDDASSAQALRPIADALRTFGPVTFLLGHRSWSPEGLLGDGVFQSVALTLPDTAEAQRIWAAELAEVRLAPEVGGAEQTALALAGRFRLSPGQIHNAVATARTRSLWDNPVGAALTLPELFAASREQCSHRLATLARQVTTGFGWDDLILPPRQRSQLRELEAAIRNASGVLE